MHLPLLQIPKVQKLLIIVLKYLNYSLYSLLKFTNDYKSYTIQNKLKSKVKKTEYFSRKNTKHEHKFIWYL